MGFALGTPFPSVGGRPLRVVGGGGLVQQRSQIEKAHPYNAKPAHHHCTAAVPYSIHTFNVANVIMISKLKWL